jgi:hypothetical protein
MFLIQNSTEKNQKQDVCIQAAIVREQGTNGDREMAFRFMPPVLR